MVFNATFSNILIISWRSDILVEETGIPGENHRPVASLNILVKNVLLTIVTLQSKDDTLNDKIVHTWSIKFAYSPRDRRGGIIVGFTTTCVIISAYHH